MDIDFEGMKQVLNVFFLMKFEKYPKIINSKHLNAITRNLRYKFIYFSTIWKNKIFFSFLCNVFYFKCIISNRGYFEKLVLNKTFLQFDRLQFAIANL